MAGFQNYHPSVYDEMEEAILWPSPSSVDRKFEYEPFDISAMTRLTVSNDNLLGWDNATPSPSSIISQSICNTDPMERISDTLSGNEGHDTTTNCLNFGLHNHHSSQWHVQDQDLAWQSLDHCCNNDAYPQTHNVSLLPSAPHFSHPRLLSSTHNPIYPTSNANQIAQPQPQPQQISSPLPPSHITAPLPDVFASTRAPYQDPPTPTSTAPLDARPQRKSKRCSDDLYTPRWVRYAGTSREGWCGWCSSWFTLRDSAYWYHMHYSHGVSQANSGKRLPGPAGYRAFGVAQPVEWEVKCGKCARWMALPPGCKWNTAYFRHTYKCYFKTMTSARGDRSGPSSPTKAIASPSRRRLDML